MGEVNGDPWWDKEKRRNVVGKSFLKRYGWENFRRREAGWWTREDSEVSPKPEISLNGNLRLNNLGTS